MERIFVQIASYRDTDLPKTVDSALRTAEHPERLRFGICWQYDEQTYTDLDAYLRDNRFRIEAVFYEDSGGCCWARNRCNRLYDDEEFTLQIDAHTRFAPRWDSRYLAMMADIDSDKAILSTYPAPFNEINGKLNLHRDRGMQRLILNRIRKNLTTVYKSEVVSDAGRCAPSRFIAAGQIFTLGQFCREVEYDPGLYYAGEEINLAARAYTHGYDFYCPNEDLIWHRYQHGMRTHWADHPDVFQGKALERLKILLTEDASRLGRYGLGEHRSLAQFEQHAVIDFKQRLRRKPTPLRYKQSIELDVSSIADRDDYHFWIFTLRNIDDDEIFRHDIYDQRILRKVIRRIEVDEQLEDEPVSYMLWPNVKNRGFLEQHYFDL